MVITARALRQAGKLKADGTSADLAQFSDSAEVADYAAADVAAMVKEGLLESGDGRLNPLGTMTRAEAAVLIYKVFTK